ncbi:uncharacterized protein LOC111355669 [Spodoptera litura]|uniref:Uncharacterized protein LOC111355669 n=1 Tax=Spodoptera litura TaxID=69820 RepID=A0A9J7EB44_SPOLT|nr:uncharacterized protein LOC111355669 [Spodoptera litura]
MRGVVVVLSCVLAFAFASTSSVNYCGAKMCGGKNTHTFCQYPEGPSPNCIGYVNIKLRNREKARLLRRLNSGRNKFAGGSHSGFPPAANMLQLHWVEELAREAQRWADQCRRPRRVEEHDTCRDLYSVTVGQCVASKIGETPRRIDFMVDIWNKQSQYYNHSILNYEPPSNDKYYYGDFAQLYWAKSYMVGCARSRFQIIWKGGLKFVERLVCNVAPAGPEPYDRLWRPHPPTELCPYRATLSSSWRNLCDYRETSRELQEELKRDELDLSRKGKKRKHRRKQKHRKIPHRLREYLSRSRRSKRDKPNDYDDYPIESSSNRPREFDRSMDPNTDPNIASRVAPSIVMVWKWSNANTCLPHTSLAHILRTHPSLVLYAQKSSLLNRFHQCCRTCLLETNKMRGVVVVLSCVLALAATSSVKYCGASMCEGKNTHTYCQYPEGPSPSCNGYIKVKLRSREKARLLKRFNSGRNKAAAGGLKGFPPAANMLKLHWVEELAREAQRWADQCRRPRRPEEHDTCRDLYSLTVGQCVASAIGKTPQRVDFMVDIWNRQSKYYNHSVTRYEPPSNGTKYYYGDFAQLYWAKSYMIGCARSRFQTQWKGSLQNVERLVCNVAPAGPKRHRRLWRPQAPAELCPYRARVSSTWINLCDYPESVRELQEALKVNEQELSRSKGKKKKHRKVLLLDIGNKRTITDRLIKYQKSVMINVYIFFIREEAFA